MDGRAYSRGSAALVGALLAVGAVAQSDEDREGPPPSPPGTVLSDAEPLPAEDRDSSGAILLRHSPVRAQRAGAVDEAGAGVRAIGHGVTQVLGGPSAAPPVADAHPDPQPNAQPKN
jgi:hypothetical protein